MITRPFRPMPADFPAIGPTLTQADACRHWNAGQACVRRWHKENGSVTSIYNRHHRIAPPGEACPPDFASVAPGLNKRQLCKRYRIGTKKLNGWLKAAGVSAKPVDHSETMFRYRATLPPPPPKPPRVSRRRIFKYAGPLRRALPPRDYSMFGQAADHLRRLAPVYRCRESGRADQTGDFYRFGNVILTPDELLHRAKDKGWELCLEP